MRVHATRTQLPAHSPGGPVSGDVKNAPSARCRPKRVGPAARAAARLRISVSTGGSTSRRASTYSARASDGEKRSCWRWRRPRERRSMATAHRWWPPLVGGPGRGRRRVQFVAEDQFGAWRTHRAPARGRSWAKPAVAADVVPELWSLFLPAHPTGRAADAGTALTAVCSPRWTTRSSNHPPPAGTCRPGDQRVARPVVGAVASDEGDQQVAVVEAGAKAGTESSRASSEDVYSYTDAFARSGDVKEPIAQSTVFSRRCSVTLKRQQLHRDGP